MIFDKRIHEEVAVVVQTDIHFKLFYVKTDDALVSENDLHMSVNNFFVCEYTN